jgi:hypothetical protein
MYYIGIDNGPTGSIAALRKGIIEYYPMPVYQEQSYTKKAQMTTHVDTQKLREILIKYINDPEGCMCLRERPFTGMFYKAVVSAARADEATTIVLRELNMRSEYCDSRDWQRKMLPQDMGKIITTKSGHQKRKVEPRELKEASHDIACRLFPTARAWLLKTTKKGIKKIDGDSILIAEYCRRFIGD